MPHQCVHCGKLYEDGSPILLSGCTCGSRFFFFVRQESLDKLKEETKKLSDDERKEIENDVKGIIGPDIDMSKPVILDMESIRVRKPGKFEIDLVNLFRRKPLVYKIEDGKYIIDIASTFQIGKEKEK